MYYVIEYAYIGSAPYAGSELNSDLIQICTVPARTDDHSICLEGWCGTVDNLCVTAHGEFETLEEARETIFERFIGAHKIDSKKRQNDTRYPSPEDDFENDAYPAIETYRPVKQLSDETIHELFAIEAYDKTLDFSSDRDIAKLAKMFEAEANKLGTTTGQQILYLLLKHRLALRRRYCKEINRHRLKSQA